MIHLRPSKVGLLPCIFIVLLWLFLPPPDMQTTPELDPMTKLAALRALEKAQMRFHSRILGRKVLQGAPNANVLVKSEVSKQILMVSAISPKPCPAENGDYYTLLSIKNKQDYARIKGIDFYLSNVQSDKELRGAWNKVALIRDLLHHTQYEWIIWVDYDSLIMDLKFDIPFQKYEGKDFVLWGQEKELFEVGDAHMGLNTGVFMVRNTPWAKRMFNETAKFGKENGKIHEQLLKEKLGNYDWALFDQNGFTYVLKYWEPALTRQKVFLEHSYYLNGYWKDLSMDRLKSLPHKPFIKHFMGCQLCSGINTQDAQVCQEDFRGSFEMVNAEVLIK